MAIVFPASPSTNDTFTAGSITYKWDGDKWIGLGVTPADRLIEGSNSLEITANNELQWTGGNVGIGTDPTRPLHLHNTSTSALLVSGTAPQIRFNSDSADGNDNERGIVGLATGAGQFMANAANGDLVIRSEDANSILFGEGTTESARFDANGRLIIGNSTATITEAKIEAYANNAGNNDVLCLYNKNAATGNTANILFAPANQVAGARIICEAMEDFTTSANRTADLAFVTRNNGTLGEAMRLLANRTLMVGQSTQRSGDSSIAQFVANNISNTGAGVISIGRGQSSANLSDNNTLGIIRFGDNNGAEFASIVASVDGTPTSNLHPGRLEFGTCPANTGTIVTGFSILNTREVRIATGNTTSVSTDPVTTIGDVNIASVQTNLARLVMQERAAQWISFKDGNGTHHGTISDNGPGVTYGSNSDYRLKQNVSDFTDGINLVKQLRPVTFNWNELSGKDTTVTHRGFIAHEVQEIEPGAVAGEKDGVDRLGNCVDADGNVTQMMVFESQALEGETWELVSEEIHDQQLDPGKLVPVLTAALKEAIAEIETLKGRLDAAGL